MKREYIVKCMKLTERILTHTHQGDISPAIECMHDDCFWIGPLENQFCSGKQKIIDTVLKQKGGYPKIYLQSQEFMCGAQDSHGCIIIGKYIAVTDSNSDQLFRNQQRATFAWEVLHGELKITHIHISAPRGTANETEDFPSQLGRYTKEYLNMLIVKKVEKSGRIILKDIDNIYHIVQVSDIVYCEGYNKNAIVHTVNGNIQGRTMLSALEKNLFKEDDNMFIRAHKSFIVNKYYVSTIHRYELGMRDGANVPISKKRYLEIKQKLHI